MRYSLAVDGDPYLARLTELAAAPLGLDLSATHPQFTTTTEHHDFPAAECVVAVVVRSRSGQLASYVPVRVSPTPGGVEVLAPAPELTRDDASDVQSRSIAAAMRSGLVGAMSVVFLSDGSTQEFVGPDQAGLWSLDAAHASVFHNHVRALLNLPLGSPEMLAPAAVTVTASGGSEDDPTGALQHIHARDRHARVHLHDSEAGPGLPLGHVTCFGHDVDDLRRRALHAANYLMGVDDR